MIYRTGPVRHPNRLRDGQRRSAPLPVPIPGPSRSGAPPRAPGAGRHPGTHGAVTRALLTGRRRFVIARACRPPITHARAAATDSNGPFCRGRRMTRHPVLSASNPGSNPPGGRPACSTGSPRSAASTRTPTERADPAAGPAALTGAFRPPYCNRPRPCCLRTLATTCRKSGSINNYPGETPDAPVGRRPDHLFGRLRPGTR
jgi:hypothetical protein